MDRREVLRACLGGAVLAAAGSLISAGVAEARVALPNPVAEPEITAQPAVATESDLGDARIENVQYYWRRRYWGWHRPYWGWRRRYYWGWRRRWYGRRCWINRWGNRVCRW